MMRFARLLVLTSIVIMVIILAGCSKVSSEISLNNTVEVNKNIEPKEAGPHQPVLQKEPYHFAYINNEGRVVLLSSACKQIIPTEGKVIDFSWSSTGERIALIVEKEKGSTRELAVYHIRKEKLERVPQYSDPFLSNVMWAPRGPYILLDFGTAGAGRSFTVVKAGLWDKVLTQDYSYQVCWAPDGEYVAYGFPVEINPPLPLEDGNSSSLAIISVKDSTYKILVEGNARFLYFPKWWLSNNTIIYQKLTVDGSEEPSLFQLDMTNDTQMSLDELPYPYNRKLVINKVPRNLVECFVDYSWSPDQKDIAFWVNKGGHYQIYSLNWETGQISFLDNGFLGKWVPRVPSSKN
ncbi:MAG: hypothetical protein H0Z35_06775 [Thermoanaerobacteraceae bacterium]|nr:hypothetical protein [Thermoanaerobacteraceae bacterium]